MDNTNNISADSFIENRIIEELKKVYDPEIPVNIYDIGLIYKINTSVNGNVSIVMTLTSPNCPVAETLPSDVSEAVKKIKEVKNVDVQLVFDPPWNVDMMSDEAKLELGML